MYGVTATTLVNDKELAVWTLCEGRTLAGIITDTYSSIGAGSGARRCEKWTHSENCFSN